MHSVVLLFLWRWDLQNFEILGFQFNFWSEFKNQKNTGTVSLSSSASFSFIEKSKQKGSLGFCKSEKKKGWNFCLILVRKSVKIQTWNQKQVRIRCKLCLGAEEMLENLIKIKALNIPYSFGILKLHCLKLDWARKHETVTVYID